MNKLFFNCLHQFILCLHPILRLLCNLNKILECICMQTYIHICKSRKNIYWPFIIFESSSPFCSHHAEFSKASQKSSLRAKNFLLAISTSKGVVCSVGRQKERERKWKHFMENINIIYTVMRVQWSISSRFFFHEKFAKVHIG